MIKVKNDAPAIPVLEVRDLYASVEGKPILQGVTLTVGRGELHVLMGPNGSGKSTLANALAGAPNVTVASGAARLDGHDLLAMSPDERARAGLFLGFQYPVSIPGLSLTGLIAAARAARALGPVEKQALPALLKELQLAPEMVGRDVNEGLSGGEKKKSEIAQLTLLPPLLAILDEPDSGLDIDSLQLIARAIDRRHREGTAVLLITHYQRIVQFLRPDAVHVMASGRVVKSGPGTMAAEIERTGYAPLLGPNPAA
ncbi:MAG: iron-regulated ABC transporter ATPase subunit SufC [Parcubacteria group bacterium Gr01-1014_31]|nr:MAG: iron-regulated ABC transporter ATPase subunit SufC [Parcubacteria group bacterium Gr01-1014_31]